jgi:hypothetical protein
MEEDSVQLFEDFVQLINEVSASYAPANGAIAASSDPPRKDFGVAGGGNGYPPNMSSKGLLDPYQQHPFSTMPDPERPAHLPYPMDTVHSFLGDSYVYLNTALTQMKMVIKNNQSLDTLYKKELQRMIREGQACLKTIRKIGTSINKAANLNY